MVWVLKSPNVTTYHPCYHTKKMCPMVRFYEDEYVAVPKWLAERAGLKHCRRNGPCRR